MSILVLLTYTGKDGSAHKFAEEMERSGTTALIRGEDGNERYEYFFPFSELRPFCSLTDGETRRP